MKTVWRPAWHRAHAPWLFIAVAALGGWMWAGRTHVAAAPPRSGPVLPTVRLAARQDSEATVKETFGAVTMAWVVETHLAIGMLGDAVGKELYDLETGENVLALLEQFIEANRQRFRSLAKSDELDPSDQQLMRDLSKACGLLLDQCDALRGIWEGDEAAADDWSDLREETGELIDRLGGEGEPASPAPPGGLPEGDRKGGPARSAAQVGRP